MAQEQIGKFLPKAKGRVVDPNEDSRPHRAAAYIAGGILATGGLLAYQQHRILQHAAKSVEIAARKERGAMYRDVVKKVTETMRAPKVERGDTHRGILESVLQKNRHRIDFPKATDPNYGTQIDRLMKKVHGPIEGAADIIASKPESEAQKQIHGIKTGRINSMVEDMATGRANRIAESEARDRFHKEVVTPVFKKHGLPVNLKDLSGLPKEDAERISRHVYSKEHGEMIDPASPPSRSDIATRVAARIGTARQRTGTLKEPKGPGIRNDKRPMAEGGISAERYNKKRDRDTKLSRLTSLILLDYNPSEKRNKNGQWSNGQEVMTDPRTMQNAYHRPNAQGGFDFNSNGQKRGRGRPLGSLNRRTLAQKEVEEQAIAAQPESKQGLGLGTKALIGAGVLAGASLVVGPKVAPALKASRRAAQAVERIGGRIGQPVTAGSNAIFGERLATQAEKTGTPIEEAIVKRVENISKLRSERLDKAAKWAKTHKAKPATDNPFTPTAIDPRTGVSQWHPARDTKAQRRSKAERDIAVAGERIAKSDLNVAGEQVAHARTKADLEKAKLDRDDYKKRFGELHPQFADAQRRVRDLENQLSKVVVEPTHTKKVSAASRTLDALANPSGDRFSPKQDELFVAAKVGTTPLGTGDYARRVEAVKQRNLANRGEEIAAISKAHGHEPEHVAEAMAHREIQGQLTRYAPAPKRPGALAHSGDKYKYSEGLKSLRSDLVNADKVAVDIVRSHSAKAAHEAKASFNEKLKAGGITKLNDRLEKERDQHVKAAADRAAHAITTQLISEGKLPRNYLRGVHVGTRATARELAFARRLKQRTELQRQGPRELVPGMIEFSRGDVLKRMLPDFPLPIGGEFKKAGFVQKEAADAIRDIIKKKRPKLLLGVL